MAVLAAGAVLLTSAGLVGATWYRHEPRTATHDATGTTAVTTTPTIACAPSLYQPCGQAEPAPGTDGTSCLAGRADFDGILANGCEAVSDYQEGQTLQEGQPLSANLVPANAVDTFQAQIAESFLHFCFASFRVTLTAPAGTTDKVEIIDNGKILATATSSNQQLATATAAKPSCFASGSAAVTIQVTDVTGQSAQDFQLASSGSW